MLPLVAALTAAALSMPAQAGVVLRQASVSDGNYYPPVDNLAGPASTSIVTPGAGAGGAPAAASSEVKGRSISLGIDSPDWWSPGYNAFGKIVADYYVMLGDSAATAEDLLGWDMLFNFSVAGRYEVDGSPVDDRASNAYVDVQIYGGGGPYVGFGSRFSSVCSAPAYGGCSEDLDGDTLLMNGSTTPATTDIGFGFSLNRGPTPSGQIWMALNNTTATGDHSRYRLRLDGVSFLASPTPLSVAGLSQGALASPLGTPDFRVFLADGTSLVPEPETLWLLGFGLALLTAGRRGARRHSQA